MPEPSSPADGSPAFNMGRLRGRAFSGSYDMAAGLFGLVCVFGVYLSSPDLLWGSVGNPSDQMSVWV